MTEQKFELIISTESKVLACNITDFEKQAEQFLSTLTATFETDDDFAAAKNYALDAAQGEWILFLDADEYFSPRSLPRVREYIRKYQHQPQVAVPVKR